MILHHTLSDINNSANRDTVDPGLVGLSLTYAFTAQLDIFLMTRYFADLEKTIVSVERIREYQNTPVEAAPLRPDSDPPKSEGWPRSGTIEFRDYREVRPSLQLQD